MIDLQDDMKSLLNILHEYHKGNTALIWNVCFHWWKLLYRANTKIEGSPTDQKKFEVIDEIDAFRHKMNALYDEIETAYGVKKEGDADDIDPETAEISIQMKNIIKLMRHEKDRFADHVKQLKNIKKGKSPGRSKLRRGHKWIRS